MDQQPIPLQQQQQLQQELSQQQQELENVATPAIHMLQSIQESHVESFNDDSDSDEEDRAMKKNDDHDDLAETLVTRKELNMELFEKLIDQPNLVQEIQQGKNSKLLNYISQDDVVKVLISYLIESVPHFEKLFYEEQKNSVPHEIVDEEDDEEDDEEIDKKLINGDEEEFDEELPYGKETTEEKYRRRASTAAEILSIQDPPIISQRLLLPITDKDAIKSNEVTHFELLGQLWNGMYDITYEVENVINLTLFVKIIENLINFNANEFMNFIRQNQQKKLLVNQILRHADIPQLMDLLIRLISLDKIDHPIGLIDLLHDQKLIIKLLKLLESDDSLSLQTSIGDFLTNLISISANTPALYGAESEALTNQMESPIIGPNDLTRNLVSKESIQCIIKIIMKGGSCLPTCVSLIIELIRKNNSDYDSIDLMDDDFTLNPPNNRDPIFVGGMLKWFSEKLIKIFNRFFDDDYFIELVNTTMGIQEPVGFERFKIIELIAELLHCSNMLLVNHLDAENAIAKRDDFKIQQINLMNDALLDNIIGEFELGDLDNDIKPYLPSLQDRSSSSNNDHAFASGTGGMGGGDGSTSLVDLEKLTNDIKSFSVGSDATSSSILKIEEEADESKPDNMSIGDFFKTQLVKGGMLIKIFAMLQKFPWNNFLHNVIFDIAQQVLNGRYDETNLNRDLILELFDREKCYCTNYIIDCYKLSSEKEEKEGLRLGYMGHLILISEELVKFSSKVYAAVENHDILLDDQQTDDSIVKEIIRINDQIHDIISDTEWLDYVNTELVTIRDMYNQVLGGVRPDENSTYLNPSTILLGNGEDDSNEEAVEDYDALDGDDDDTVKDVMDISANGDLSNIEVIEGTEEITNSDEDSDEEDEEEEEFGEALHPTSKHNSTNEIATRDN